MTNWSHGYEVSMGYTFGFFREMGPDWLDLCARISGYEPPQRSGGAFRYLELGSGQGLGLCLLAAANPAAEFVGVDFQPEHIAHSQGLAEAAGLTNVRFIEADFMELAAGWPEDFGTFDYVALHGIFSWVSTELRAAVLQCIVHAARPGALVYVSYNTQPGWTWAAPIRHFMRSLKESGGKPAAVAADEAVELLNGLAAAKAPVFEALPALAPKVQSLRGRQKSYLVHEYLGESWQPFWHSEVRKQFQGAKLDYVGSATLADNLVAEFLPEPLHRLVTGQPDEQLRNDLQDFVINQAFRRDIYCMGPRRQLGSGSLGKELVYLTAAPELGRPVNFETSFGQVSWDPAVFTGIVGAVSSGPTSLAELFALPNPTPWHPRHVLLLMLHATMLGVGAAMPGSVEAAERMNAVLARAVCDGAPYRQVAAARLGSAVPASEAELLLLDAWFEAAGNASAATLASGLSSRLTKLGRRAEGEPATLATQFIQVTVPRWRQLGALA